jgi:aminopeptidase N
MTTISEDTTYDSRVFLELATATQRFNCVKDVSYHVDLCLAKGEHYTGVVTTTFYLSQAPKDNLFLDFRGLKVANLEINGAQVLADFRDHHVTLPVDALRVNEQNTVTMVIMNKYRNDGCGLHSYTDSADGLQYLYT